MRPTLATLSLIAVAALAGCGGNLSLDRIEDNAFAASDLEITDNWISAEKQAVLFIDPSHTECQVAMTSLGEAGARGTLSLMP